MRFLNIREFRVNKERIKGVIELLSKHSSRVSVVFSDGVSYLEHFLSPQSQTTFIYLDPPYYQKGKQLYRFFFDDAAHQNLAKKLIK